MADLLLCQHFTHIRFACRVPDHPGPAAEQCDWGMPRPLQMRHDHNRNEMAHMQAVCGRVEAHVKHRFFLIEQMTYPFGISRLRDESPLFQFFINSHDEFLQFRQGV